MTEYESICRKRSHARWRVFDQFMMVVAFILFAQLVGPTLGKWEGSFFPVARNFEITSVVPSVGESSIIRGNVTILRPSCHFVGIKWNEFSPSGRHAPVRINFMERSRVREAGPSRFGPWGISIPPEDLERTRAVVLHQCPYRFWLTETTIYPTIEE